MESGLLKKVSAVFHPFRKSSVVNEWKWFCAEMMIVSIYAIIILGYIFQHWIITCARISKRYIFESNIFTIGQVR